MGVAEGWIRVAVGGRGVTDGEIGVKVGGRDVADGGSGVFVGLTGVDVAKTMTVVGNAVAGIGVAVATSTVTMLCTSRLPSTSPSPVSLLRAGTAGEVYERCRS